MTNELEAFVALISFPASTFLLPEPTGFAWGMKNNSPILPPDVRKRSEKIGRYVWIFRYAVLIGWVLFLSHKFSAGISFLLPTTSSALRNFLLGSFAGGGLLICRSFLRFVMPALPYIERQYSLLEGPESLWFAIIAIGGLSEELWRALCILCLERTADNAFFPIVATSAAFAIGRLGGIPGRGSGEVVDVGSEFMTGLLLGGLFIWSGSVLAASSANIVYYASSFFYLRRR
jgi:hypothetical protein